MYSIKLQALLKNFKNYVESDSTSVVIHVLFVQKLYACVLKRTKGRLYCISVSSSRCIHQSVPALIFRSNTTFRTLHIQLPSTICFGHHQVDFKTHMEKNTTMDPPPHPPQYFNVLTVKGGSQSWYSFPCMSS